MKKRLLMAVVACVTVLSLALFGCSGNKAEYEKNFVGSWTVVSMSSDSITMTESDMESLRAFGFEVVLTLNEDKTALMTYTGEEDSTGTWEANSATEMSLTLDGDTGTLTLADEKLTYDYAGTTMTFAKTDGLSTASTSSSSSSGLVTGAEANGDKESADVNQSFGDSNCTLVATRKAIDVAGDPEVYFSVENKLDKDIYLTITDDSASIDGTTYKAIMATTVKAGETQDGEDFMYFTGASAVESLDDFKNIKFTVEVWDDATYETLGTFVVSIA